MYNLRERERKREREREREKEKSTLESVQSPDSVFRGEQLTGDSDFSCWTQTRY